MKQIIVALSLIILCTQHSLFSMETDTKTEQTIPILSAGEIVTKISNIINAQYSTDNYFSTIIADAIKTEQLTHQDLLAIMHVTAKNCPEYG